MPAHKRGTTKLVPLPMKFKQLDLRVERLNLNQFAAFVKVYEIVMEIFNPSVPKDEDRWLVVCVLKGVNKRLPL